MSAIEIVSINIGTAEEIGTLKGEPVISAIRKLPVEGNGIYLGEFGFIGDTQVDQTIKKGRQVHGGIEKAVSIYSRSHYPYWTEILNKPLLPGAFGENITIDGLTEETVRIGDTLVCGNAVLEITEHRRPCYKLGVLHPGAPVKMIQTGFCGWYARVRQPGTVQLRGRVQHFSGPDSGITVLQSFRAKTYEDQPIPGPNQIVAK